MLCEEKEEEEEVGRAEGCSDRSPQPAGLVQRSEQLKPKGCLLAGLTWVSRFNNSQQGEGGSQAPQAGEG